MSISDLLFGKKKTFNHPILGTLKSDRIKGNNQTKTYTWRGSIIIGNNTIETLFYLEGNYAAPFNNHIDFVCQLAENWNSEHLPNIEEKINKKGIDKVEPLSNWKKDLYLAAIYAANKKNTDFELTLEPIDSENLDSIGIDVKNGIISKVKIY
ncbi:hypothetical protein [uncultured Maribacter sp.]|uniref:hypothetical protein n=1 Tax=uncultured Maribacter sp. TaxID=431308 RepID=UPI00262F3898|nr:hypothetical protein [uncultured Maribacter sp.]